MVAYYRCQPAAVLLEYTEFNLRQQLVVKTYGIAVTVQTWWVELAEGGLPNAGTGGGGYVIYRAWILKLTSPPSTAMC